MAAAGAPHSPPPDPSPTKPKRRVFFPPCRSHRPIGPPPPPPPTSSSGLHLQPRSRLSTPPSRLDPISTPRPIPRRPAPLPPKTRSPSPPPIQLALLPPLPEELLCEAEVLHPARRRRAKSMDFNSELRREKVRKYEEFVDRRLKPDLVDAVAQRDKVFQRQKVFSDLKKNIQTLEQNGATSLRTMVNLGSEVYMQADVADTRHVFVDIGLGFHVEFTWAEALEFIPVQEEREKIAQASASRPAVVEDSGKRSHWLDDPDRGLDRRDLPHGTKKGRSGVRRWPIETGKKVEKEKEVERKSQSKRG